MRRLAAALVLAVPVAASAAQAERRPDDPSKVVVVADGKSLRATLGWHCFPSADGSAGQCVDGAYPLKTSGRLRLEPGEQLTIRIGAPASQVGVRLARLDGARKEALVASGPARPASRSMRTFRYELPRKLRRVTIVGISVEYPNARADFEVGARARR